MAGWRKELIRDGRGALPWLWGHGTEIGEQLCLDLKAGSPSTLSLSQPCWPLQGRKLRPRQRLRRDEGWGSLESKSRPTWR